MRRLPLSLSLLLLAAVSLACALEAGAQSRAASVRGSWNYPTYAKDKSELPPADAGAHANARRDSEPKDVR